MTLSAVGVWLVVAVPAFAQIPRATDPYEPLKASEKFTLMGQRTIDTAGFAKSAVTAGIAQLRDNPHEWEQGMAGYGRRYGHRLANRAVENAIGFGTAVAFHQDPRYFRSGEEGVWRRTRYAVVNTFLTRTDGGSRTIAAWRFAGNYGAAFVSNTWRPDRINGASDALQRGSISIGFDVANNIFKEFWPDIRRKLRGR